MQKRHCNLGDKCLFAHNVFEYWLHPTRYRTVMCSDGANCERTVGCLSISAVRAFSCWIDSFLTVSVSLS